MGVLTRGDAFPVQGSLQSPQSACGQRSQSHKLFWKK